MADPYERAGPRSRSLFSSVQVPVTVLSRPSTCLSVMVYFDHNMSQTGYGILLVFTKDFAFGFPKRISKDGLSKKIFPRPSGWDTLA